MQLDERPGGAPESEDIEDMMRGGVGVQRQVRSPPRTTAASWEALDGVRRTPLLSPGRIAAPPRAHPARAPLIPAAV